MPDNNNDTQKVPVNFKFVTTAELLENLANFNDGDIIFCEEDKRIYLKMDNGELVNYGGTSIDSQLGNTSEPDIAYIRINKKWGKLSDYVDVNLVPRINKPTVINPSNNAVDINQIPHIVGSMYSHSYNIPMHSKEIQISKSTNFDNEEDIVYQFINYSQSAEFQIPLKDEETKESYFTPATDYYIRIRYSDINGNYSVWSDVVKFTTAPQFNDNILCTPKLLIPSHNSTMSNKAPKMHMTEPKSLDENVVFDKAQWQISSEESFENDQAILLDEITSDTHNIDIDNSVLISNHNNDFYARARQGTNDDRFTPWSAANKFTLLHKYDNLVFGFRRIFNHNLNEPLIYNLDEVGNLVDIDDDYFITHPFYNNVQKVSLLNYYKGDESGSGAAAETDRSYYRVVPITYYKYKVYYDEDGHLVIDEWFSPYDMSNDSNWMLHPAFMKNKNHIYISQGLPTVSGNVYYASANQVNQYYSDYNTAYNPTTNSYLTRSINSINNGFGMPHMYTIYERMLHNDLRLAQFKTYAVSNTTWNNFLNIDVVFNTPYTNSYASLYLQGFSATTQLTSHTEQFEDRENGQILTANYNINTVNNIYIDTPMFNDTKITLPVEGLSVVTYNDSPTNKTNYPVTAKAFRVKDIATGYYDALGFDIALLQIPIKYEEVDITTDLTSNKIFGFPNRFMFNLPNKSTVNWFTMTAAYNGNDQLVTFGPCGIVPSGTYYQHSSSSRFCIWN